ncbi:ABC-three component system middle component 2 [Desulforamulus ruminis]|uniref:Uncharacterized protein n=1 Tax=Desulforamulus ruminis (strain ATCC 23193 / DSM 2154 / NCIMB 8452 / DL) TaxID=696281 RepID=F6DMM1_DESRL|nr:ABC-three component system middle component 2 [Desulforamulus ruminis]AEG61782.1 hypothetical protein Desru_3579 [Desulforamulus ruminis DSM 2154]
MNNVFNTPFEISLRALLILETAGERWVTADMIAAADFITVYGRDFGISDVNLHGENSFKFSEFTLRRELMKKAVKLLVKNGLINVSPTDNGFSYSINQKGIDYCARFTNDYADTYRRLAKQARAYIAGKSEREMLALINRHALSSLQRSEIDV